MSTIAFPSRPPGYLARQGYVRPLWEVVLRRSDNWWRYVPDDEAYNLPALKEKLESDKYSISTIDHVTVELTRTDELVGFLKGLRNPKHLRIKIFTYHIFRKGQKQLVWFGQLQNLPEGVDAYPWDKLKLTFMSPPGAWEDGDEVMDPDTGSAYRNKHVKDLLPEFLKEARKKGKEGTYDWKVEPPKVRGKDYFWSSYEIPHKKLARSDAAFDLSNKTTGICWDTSRSVLYVGVRGAAGARENPWLVSFNPTTRKWTYITQFKYVGSKIELQFPTEWVVQHLEYSAAADKVYFVCQTGHQNLLDVEAHYKCKGEIDLTAVPGTVQLTEANLFTLHDKGISIRSKPTYFNNRGGGGVGDVPTVDDVDYYADAQTGAIGWGTPRHSVKECGPLKLGANFYGAFLPNFKINSGDRIFPVLVSSDPEGQPRVDDVFFIYDKTDGNGRKENLGNVQKVEPASSSHTKIFFYITTQYATRYKREFTAVPNAEWCVCRDAVLPKDNVFIAEPQEIQVEYLYPKDVGSVEAETIYVEARTNTDRGDNFFWPQDLGEITETGKFKIDYVGYVSFMSIRSMGEYKSTDTYKKYKAGESAPFKITLKGYNPSFLIEDGFYTASRLQYHPLAHPCRNQAGPCRVLHNGAECYDNEGQKVETYGDIYLFKTGSNIYAAWNARGEPEPGHFFNKCRVGKWNGKVFVIVFTDRWGNDYYKAPECYIESAIKHRGHFYFGRRYYERNWIDTALRIFYAIKPIKGIGCHNYDGTLTVICAVKGDKTDVIQAGSLIRLRDTGTSEAKGKIYFVSEIGTGTEYVGSSGGEGHWIYPARLAEGEDPYLGQITWFTLLSIDGRTVYDAWSYSAQVAREVEGKYITIANGRDERHQVAKL